ncbi:hypothetical protein MD484_g4837, partial [Candolleomyces efflorescens]
MCSTLHFIPRRSEERGHADHGWLKTYHTFSFAMYQDPKHQQYGPLRVMNEDRVSPLAGFGTHSHREFEIFSYIVSGELEHKDSMSNVEILTRGHIQLTSAGTGITHTEKNPNRHGVPVHFLQIWSIPTQPRLKPAYYTRHFTDDMKKDKWAKVVAPVDDEGVQKDLREGEGTPAPVHSGLTMYATILSSGKMMEKELSGTKVYVHVIQTSSGAENAQGARVKLSDGAGGELVLGEGDGAYVSVNGSSAKLVVENVSEEQGQTAEILLFDMDAH